MKIGKLRTTLLLIIIIILSGMGGYWYGVNKVALDWKNYKPVMTVQGKEPPPNSTNLDLTLFWVVLDKLKANYYDQSAIVPQNLVNGAISGMVQSLDDPYTVYLPPTQNTQFKQGLSGKFEGIGAELGMDGKQIIVVAPIEGSPAEKAGLKPGDAILKVDGNPTQGWTLNQAVDKIKGPKGTMVKLSIVHKGEDKLQDVTITRDEIQMKSVAMQIKKIKDVQSIKLTPTLSAHQDDEVAYIRLAQFGDDTNKEWVSLINELTLKQQTDKNIKGIVLDIRNNPGGYLNDAVFIASEFLQQGDVVVMQDDGKSDRVSIPTSRKGLLPTIPLVIIINKGSASASEILSGALHDHKRAVLVGENSFGKGIIQEAEDLGNTAGLHITVAKWLTPNGTWVGNGKNGQGLTPDVPVQLDPKQPTVDTQLTAAIEQLVK